MMISDECEDAPRTIVCFVSSSILQFEIESFTVAELWTGARYHPVCSSGPSRGSVARVSGLRETGQSDGFHKKQWFVYDKISYKSDCSDTQNIFYDATKEITICNSFDREAKSAEICDDCHRLAADGAFELHWILSLYSSVRADGHFVSRFHTKDFDLS